VADETGERRLRMSFFVTASAHITGVYTVYPLGGVNKSLSMAVLQ